MTADANWPKGVLGDRIYCEEPECLNWIPNHRWSKTKNEDWFHTKDGLSYCPDHIPDWVPEWREHQDLRKRERNAE